MSYIISLVGGGGKTSTMNFLAKKYASSGKKVVISTTTHIKKPDFFIDEKNIRLLSDYDFDKRIAIVGRDHGEKLSAISSDTINYIDKIADILLLESDGAKGLPIKLPEKWEPALYKDTDMLIVCVGIDAVGKPMADVCFRHHLATALYGFKRCHFLTEVDLAKILTDKNAGLKCYKKNMSLTFVINKADNANMYKKAEMVKAHIQKNCSNLNLCANVYITSYFYGLYPEDISITL